MLLLTLPLSYGSIVIALETMNDYKKTLDFVKSKLLDIELQHSDNNNKVKETSGATSSEKANKYLIKNSVFHSNAITLGK